MRCPICGKDNNCAISHGKDPKECWCHNVEFPKKKFGYTSCICIDCVNKLLKEEKENQKK